MPHTEIDNTPEHPGSFVRREILDPKKMTVTAAAKLLGVGRPALSNFLNGKASATKEMANKLAQAFGVPAKKILQLQSEYDGHKAATQSIAESTALYVAPYLNFKSTDVENWAERNIPARIRLPVLLRTLVHSTDATLTTADFPGNNDGERHGWDGYTESEKGNSWVPKGKAGWEIGTTPNVAKKAEDDYSARTSALDVKERMDTTFVFVSPRHWPGKSKWLEEKRALGEWKEVKAYDSSDIEQWLDHSHAGQIWFANETGSPVSGVRTLAQCWSDWAEVANPTLSPKLFDPAIKSSRLLFETALQKQPNRPTVIAADSTEEALAFLSQLFLSAGDEEEKTSLASYFDRVLVFDKTGIIPKLALGAMNFIAVAASRDVEVEFGRYAKHVHTVVVYPRNATTADIDFTLKPLSYTPFREALEDMDLDRDEIDRLERESGRSPTVLRRRLSSLPAIRTPQWASDEGVASQLAPFLLVGAWSAANSTDQTALALLADEESYDVLDKTCHRLARLNDAPVWAVGTYRGVVSKIDLLFAIAGSVGSDDLKKYFDLAKIVLSEDDPKLDVPENERWFADMRGKSREFSAVLRQGVAETLVLLAVHGNTLFRSRLGIDCEVEIERLLREILDPITTRKLEANDRDLPVYAEAAPETFLKLLEADLQADKPAVYGLLRPAESSIFGACPRTGLIWALEILAWNPEQLPRVAAVLANLSEIEIEDNWVNKPINTLQSIFRVWMPQTAASHQERLQVIRSIKEMYPEVAWQICIEQIHTGHGSGDYNQKPKWRADAQGFGEPFDTWGPIIEFMRDLIEMIFAWESYSCSMLSDLVRRLPDFHKLDKNGPERVWELIDAWLKTGPSDKEKAELKEVIRRNVLSRRGRRRSNADDYVELSKTAKETCERLEPEDLLYRYEWLFRTGWVEDSADELVEEDTDFKERERRISEKRVFALEEILGQRGLEGIIGLCLMGDCAFEIGRLMSMHVLSVDDSAKLIQLTLQDDRNEQATLPANCRRLIGGILFGLFNMGEFDSGIGALKENISAQEFCTALISAPFRRDTWAMVDELPEKLQEEYWATVPANWIHSAEDENNEAVERLLHARRPKAAFACVHFKLEDINPELLFKMMSDIVTPGSDSDVRIQLEDYYIDKAFRIIDGSPEIPLEEKARLELAYMDALAQPWKDDAFGLPNLEKYIAAHPEFFVQAIVWTFKRSDGGTDPEQWSVPAEHVGTRASRGYKLLEGLQRFPGQGRPQKEEEQKLLSWVTSVRELCGQLKRLEMCDQRIGQLLSHSPPDEDGIWPSKSVRNVMEKIRSEDMMRGAHTGLYNSRGVHTRGEGGAQERELANKYRRWANALKATHPYVSSELLMGMVKTYEYEADSHDLDADLRRRLH